MRKILFVSSVFALCNFNLSAQVENAYLEGENKDQKLIVEVEQSESAEMLLLPSFSQLPQENQRIKISNQEEKIMSRYQVKTTLGNDTPDLKLAGTYLKKGGNQIIAGSAIPLTTTVLAVMLLLVAGTTTTTTYSGSGGYYTSTSSNTPIIITSYALLIGGALTGVIFNISGGSNIAKAGKILRGETISTQYPYYPKNIECKSSKGVFTFLLQHPILFQMLA